MNRQTKDVNKVTPGGTRLPDGPPPIDQVEKDPMPPPLPPVPPMPLGDYEEYYQAGVNTWLGPQSFHVGSKQDMVIYMASGTAAEVEFNKYQIPKQKGSNDLSKNSGTSVRL